jgi:lipoprotein-releasing system permease protein
VYLDRYEDLMAMDDLVYQDYLGLELRSQTVRDRFPEIFAWLELLDTNVVVVILLMIIVAIINMTSALLIIILERTPMIGVLKALGASDGRIRRIFLIDAAYIVGVGIVLGDALGLALCLVQQTFGLVTLPVESYYVDAVPVAIELWPIVLLNLGTLVVCLVALLLPSTLVTRIAPAKAIRFS